MSINILLVEDDELFSETIEEFLVDLNFKVTVSSTVQEAIELTYDNSYDLYIFDINLPDSNGLDLLKSLRLAEDKTSTIFLTSYKDMDTLKSGFSVGADDFLRKPVDLDELELRIKALLKRAGKQFHMISLKENITYEPNTKTIKENGVDLKVSAKIIDLLELFLQNNKKQIITKEMIIERLWGDACDYSEGSIRVYINQLKKFFPHGCIVNLKSVGYRFEF